MTSARPSGLLQDDTKAIARDKLSKMERNILYEDFSFDDTQLDAYYDLIFSSPPSGGASWLQQKLTLEHFAQTRQLLTLLKPVNRRNIGDTSTLNAAYVPFQNSINIVTQTSRT